MTASALPIRSDRLAAAGLVHGFFTRQGGVSTGVYDSLNGGVGSQDDLASVAENRARMAQALGVAMSTPAVFLYRSTAKSCRCMPRSKPVAPPPAPRHRRSYSLMGGSSPYSARPKMASGLAVSTLSRVDGTT